MKELLFSDSDLDELLLIMQMSAYEADVQIGQSHDTDEVQALRAHKRTVQKWQGRFEQLKRKQAKGK